MRRTNGLWIWPIRPLWARFLQALVVEWLFPMHLDKTLPYLQRTALLQTAMPNIPVLGLETDVAQQRCAATRALFERPGRLHNPAGVWNAFGRES